MMFWFAAAVASLAAALHAARTGHMFDVESWPERLARLGISLFLITTAVGLWTKATRADEFEWFHWPILFAAVVASLGYTWLFVCQRRDNARRRSTVHQASVEIRSWLAEVDHFEPCDNADCQRIRREMADLAVTLDRH